MDKREIESLIDKIWRGIISIDQVRKQLGLPPFDLPETR